VSRYGYWVDLHARRLDDTGWIQALPTGVYEHPVYGTLEFSLERLKRFAANVKSKVRGIDPDVDFDHKEHSGRAAGWIKDAVVKPEGLFVQVDWTQAAADAIRAGEYRYFSPEFDDEWTDQHGVKHEDVLFGGALTNRPFLKDLLPVNLSEITTTTKLDEGGQMGPEQIRELLGLEKEATDDQVKAKIAELTAGPPAPTPPPTPKPTPEPTSEPVLTGISLDEAVAKALAENPILKGLQRQLDEQRKTQTFAETRQRLERLETTSGGRKFVLPPAVIDAVAEGSALSDPSEMSKKFVDAIEAFGRVGFVELGERGRTRNGQEKTATQQLSELVNQAQARHLTTTGKALPTTDAIVQVVRTNPDLYMAYRQDSYAGKED
jgi:hypothetical protein